MKFVSTDLVCPECGNVTTIQRKMSKEKQEGHIKDLYCYKCQKLTKQYEVKDVSIFLEKNRDDSFEKGNICRLILEKRKHER